MTTIETPRLPIPDLAETIQRYLTWVRPLLSEEAYQHTQETAAAFLTHEGPELQQALRTFSDGLPHGNWLIDDWLAAYLGERRPLPLASNVGFVVNNDTQAGLHQWLHALAATCADYRHGRISVPLSPQGAPVSREQWQVLLGSARRPKHHSDDYHFAENSRYIGIFYHGLYYRIPALDEQGEALSADYFLAALTAIRKQPNTAAYPVAVPAFLGAEQGAETLAKLCANPHNQTLLNDMEADLFHVCLDDTGSRDDAENLAAATFLARQQLWCYKPFTLWHNSTDNSLMLHVEHTWPDGGAIVGIVAHAQTLLADTNGGQQHIEIVPRQWQLSDDLSEQWPLWFEQYFQTASEMRVSIHTYTLPRAVPRSVSQDALMQFALQYAQLAVFGRIRNTYEAVDVSHFQRGRTECVRPVSTESVALVESLFHDQANTEMLSTALAEHKARVKACKTGHGINRHLLGLANTAKRQGKTAALFSDPAYSAITTDFFSTSTLGTDTVIRRFAFAPTSDDGFGINYALTQHGWEFTVCFPQRQAFSAAALAEALGEAVGKLFALLPAE